MKPPEKIDSVIARVKRQSAESGHAHDVPPSAMWVSAYEERSMKESTNMKAICIAKTKGGESCKNFAVSGFSVCHLAQHKAQIIPSLGPVTAPTQYEYDDPIVRVAAGGRVEIYNSLKVAAHKGLPVQYARYQNRKRNEDGRLVWAYDWKGPVMVVGSQESPAAMDKAEGNDRMDILFAGRKPVRFPHIAAIRLPRQS